jgi:hypothetical protein
MLFSPLLSYVTLGLWGLRSITYYFTLFTVFYGIVFILINNKTIKFPRLLYLLIFYSIFQTIWSFWNGGLERRGLLEIIINREFTSIIFIIIIIYNTNFNKRFIDRCISMIKVTVILAAIVSLIQVLDYSFMDASPSWGSKAGVNMLDNLYTARRTSIFGFVDRNEIGLSFIPLLSVLIGVLLFQRNRVYYIYLLLGAIIAFLSNTRYVMIALLLITFQLLVVQRVKIKDLTKYVFIIFISGFLLLRIISYLGYDFNDWYNVRLFSEGSIKETTRYKAINNFLIFFPQSPIFGFGGVTDEITDASHAIGSSQIHVGYLAHLVYYGIIGSFFLFSFWFLLAKKLYKTAKKSNYWGSLFAFLTFLWANATLVYFSIFFYGIVFALVFDQWYSNNCCSKFEPAKHQLVKKDNSPFYLN